MVKTLQKDASRRLRTVRRRRTLTDGADFSGLGTVSLALKKKGRVAKIRMSTLFASDKSSACAKITKHVARPQIFHANVLDRDVEQLPKVDIYSCASPCTGFSNAGKREGFENQNGELFFKPLEVIAKIRPTVVISENLPQITTVYEESMNVHISALKNMGYEVQWKILNTADFHIPHHRKRWYLVAILASKMRPRAFDWWPDEQPAGSLREHIDTLPPQLWKPFPISKELWTSNVLYAYEQCAKKGINPFETPVVIDMGATPHYSYHKVAMVCMKTSCLMELFFNERKF